MDVLLLLNWHSVIAHSVFGDEAWKGSVFGAADVVAPWPSSFGDYTRSHCSGYVESFFSPRVW